MRLKSLSGLLILALAAGAAPALAKADVTTYHLDGTIGGHPVGVSLSVADGKSIAAGHYYYDSQLKDIPLSGSISGRAVTLTTPTGETFHLTLQGNGGTGGDGSSFTTSVALNGTWTNGAETLPAKLGMDFVNDGLPDGHMYADVTSEGDMAFEARVARFLKAALTGDKPAVAAAVSYPLRVNGKHTLTIRTAAQLTAHWSAIFTPAMLAQLKQAVPHEMFVHEGRAMIGGGLVWFDAKGASAINEP